MEPNSEIILLAYYMNTRRALSFSLQYHIDKNCFTVYATGLYIDLTTGALAKRETDYPLDKRDTIYHNFLNASRAFGTYEKAKVYFDAQIKESMEKVKAFADEIIEERRKKGSNLKPYWDCTNEAVEKLS